MAPKRPAPDCPMQAQNSYTCAAVIVLISVSVSELRRRLATILIALASYKKATNGARCRYQKSFSETVKTLPKSTNLSTLTLPIEVMNGVTIVKEI